MALGLIRLLAVWVALVLVGAVGAAATYDSTTDAMVGDVDDVIGGVPDADGVTEVQVPAAGRLTYRIAVSGDAGETTVDEERAVVVAANDDGSSAVDITVTGSLDPQTSRVTWSPGAVVVTAVELTSGLGDRSTCVWSPGLLDIGVLRAGETWDVNSSCQVMIEEVLTDIGVEGRTDVIGPVRREVLGVSTEVWELRRTRTTRFGAVVDGATFTQTSVESGTLYLDAARGIVVASDVTVERSGEQTGTERRVSTLVAESTTR